jgi:streptomycin 6-kinase
VNGDLHSAQVLRGVRVPWLVVDPVLLRGDIAYDLARALWTRLDEIAHAAGIVGCFDIAEGGSEWTVTAHATRWCSVRSTIGCGASRPD